MSGNNFIKSIKMQNLLSFGEDPVEIKLNSLNVLIGANGSGKSNLIDVISILQSAPRDIDAPFRKSGGFQSWVWRNSENNNQQIRIETVTSYIDVILHDEDEPLVYYINIADTAFIRMHEIISNYNNRDKVYYDSVEGELLVGGKITKLDYNEINIDQSVLSQLKGSSYRVLSFLGKHFESIKIYRDWSFGRNTITRQPQPVDARNDFLAEDFSNLALVLNNLKMDVKSKNEIKRLLKEFYSGIEDFETSFNMGQIQLYLQENDYQIPATRLSDGTLRYLCLLAILCHPKPPALICIEEPELGMHPDMIPTLAKLLKEASQKTQLIITTHSDILIDALSDSPEDVLVFEKHNGVTSVKRLEREPLKEWLNEYSLGELWRKGEIGGNRW
ncbi:AAA family ATPase [Geovibrio ferrireducens]|uniref:AAA family ATPase n=1 Tax=Geovibrio ferrireducens TaxID=46201 RepID=UPI002245349B|nr:AAA family ATPase [Geovibrio ferrireducens]